MATTQVTTTPLMLYKGPERVLTTSQVFSTIRGQIVMRLVVAFTAHNFVWTDLAHAFRHGVAPRQLLRRVFKSVDRSSAGIMNVGHGLSHHSSIEGNTSGLQRCTTRRPVGSSGTIIPAA